MISYEDEQHFSKPLFQLNVALYLEINKGTKLRSVPVVVVDIQEDESLPRVSRVTQSTKPSSSTFNLVTFPLGRERHARSEIFPEFYIIQVGKKDWPFICNSPVYMRTISLSNGLQITSLLLLLLPAMLCWYHIKWIREK
jgi:hypothetical protein